MDSFYNKMLTENENNQVNEELDEFKQNGHRKIVIGKRRRHSAGDTPSCCDANKNEVLSRDLGIQTPSTSINDAPKKKHRRTVLNVAEEPQFMLNPAIFPFILHFYIAKEIFHRNVDKNSNKDLPRKIVNNHFDAIESIVHIQNQENEEKFSNLKIKFENEGKVDRYGNATEKLLFHGTSDVSINLIAENNFSLSALPAERGKVMLFGRGIYFSELPGVSLMYGNMLLLCKVLLGKSQRYYPNGDVPPEIPDEFDSRIVMKDGLEVVTVVKNPDQILPYCIIYLKQDRIVAAGNMTPQPNNNVNSNTIKDTNKQG